MKQILHMHVIEKIIVGILVCFSFFIIFSDLGKAPLDNWDEAWYGEMTKEMLATGNFAILHWNYDISLDKTPLPIWINVITSGVFGLSEFSIRLTSAISGFVVICLVSIYTYKKYGFIPFLFAYATLMFNNLFIWRTRSGNMDLLACLLMVVSFFLINSRKKSRYVLLGLIFALLYLARSSFVFFPVTIFILHDMLYRRKEILSHLRRYLLLGGLSLGIPALWLASGYMQAGMHFLQYYLFYADQNVSHISLSSFNTNYVLHTYYALQRRFFYLFLLGSILLVVKIKSSTNFLLLFFSCFLLLFLSFTQKDNNWYLIPSMPFWSITIAVATYYILRFAKRFPYADLIVKGILVGVVCVLSYKTYIGNIIPILTTSSAIGQQEAGRYIAEHASLQDVVVRLDHLYPSLLFYANRKVLASPLDTMANHDVFIDQDTLRRGIIHHTYLWISGTKRDIETFLAKDKQPPYTRILLQNDEAIIIYRLLK